MRQTETERDGREVVWGLKKQHIVTVALSACVIADEKMGQTACGCHSAAQAFWKSGGDSATSGHSQ